jgi:hypothetical protein
MEERVVLAGGLHPPPDRVPALTSRRERRAAAQRALVRAEGGEHDAEVVRLVAVVDEEARDGRASRWRALRDIARPP